MTYRSPFRDIQIDPQPLARFVLENARRYRDKPAVIDGGTGRTLTYRRLTDTIHRTAAGLKAHGLRKGDVVAIYSPNVPEYLVAFFATALGGGAVTTVNPLYSLTELNHQLRDSAARFLITHPQVAETARQACVNTEIGSPFSFGDADGCLPFDTLQSGRGGAAMPPVNLDDVVVLPYSSGTTGLPKGVMLTHRSLTTNLVQVHAVERMGPRDVLIAALPFYHVYGMAVVMMLGIRAGATLVTMPRFEARTFFDLIERYRVTRTYLVPPLVRALATHPLASRRDLSSLRDVISGGAPLPEAVARRCAERHRCRVRQLYGLTECSPVTHISPADRPRMNSVGVVLPNTEFRIVDVAHRRDLAAGELGEVWIRGPQLMKGYLNSPEATAAMIDPDRWLHTGDIGYTDEDGYLYVVDRAKELIKFRGLQYGENELLVSMVEEIASRREAVKHVSFQALLLDSVRESVIAADLKGRVTFWNKGAETLFGYEAKEILGRSLSEAIVPQESAIRTEWQAGVAELRRTGSWKGQGIRRRKDGTRVWTDMVVSLISGPDGTPAGFVAIHRDITDQKAVERSVRESREHLRQLAAKLMVIREEERTAISRELHDELGQALTGLGMDLRWLMDQLPTELQTARVSSLGSRVDKMIDTVRDICSELRPSILDDLGLEAAIEWQAQEFSNRSGCRCKLDLKLDKLTPHHDRDTAAFRIVQEALTNVARHAGATRVTLRGRILQKSLHIEIGDDGIGFGQGKLTNPRSLGLLGMRERAEAVGGRVVVHPRPKLGTLVTVSLGCVPDLFGFEWTKGSGPCSLRVPRRHPCTIACGSSSVTRSAPRNWG